MERAPRRPVRLMRAMTSGVRRIKGNLAGRKLGVKLAVELGVRRSSIAVAPGAPQPSAAVEWKPAAEASKLEDGAPKQVLRAASPDFMMWLLEKLGTLDDKVDIRTLKTHDAVHGKNAKWSVERHTKNGFGYGPPTSKGCIRALTAPGSTSVYYFITQHPEGHALRDELSQRFGPDWKGKCFGRATHFLSHSWGLPFNGFIQALNSVPRGSYVWNDIMAINQHGDAGPQARTAMQEDLSSLEEVIRHTAKVLLFFHPIDKPAAVERVWCLYEILTLISTEGGELRLVFTEEGKAGVRDIARGYMAEDFKQLDSGRRRGSKMGGSATRRSLKTTPAKRLTAALQRLDAGKAKATVPADGVMIKEKIVKTCGSLGKFNIRLRDALNATLAGYTSHEELEVAFRALSRAIAKHEERAISRRTGDLIHALERASSRELPLDPIEMSKLPLDDLNLSKKGELLSGHDGRVLTGEHAKGLAQVLRGNPTLASLSLAEHAIGAEGAKVLGRSLMGKYNSRLTHLDLSSNELGEGAAAALGVALESNRALTELSLNACGLGDADCTALAKGLLVNTVLANLALGGNEVRPNGCTALAGALRKNATLRSLHLEKNWVGNQGATALAEALKVNAGLTLLDISENQIHEPGMREIGLALKDMTVGVMRSKLQTLKLDPGYLELVQEVTEGRTNVELVARQRQIDRLSSTASSTTNVSGGNAPW